MKKGLVFSWYTDPGLPPLLEGDAPRLRQALTLLLQNAVQVTDTGSVQLIVRKNPGGFEDERQAVAADGSPRSTIRLSVPAIIW